MAYGRAWQQLNPAQRRVAETILRVGAGRHATFPELVSAMATARVEANFGNPAGGDGSSVGWRQETASSYPNADRRNVPQAAGRYFSETAQNRKSHPNYAKLSQSVQRSAFPGRYAEHGNEAKALVREYLKGGGKTPGAASASAGSAPQSRTVTETQTQFDQAGFDKARKAAVVGQLFARRHPRGLLASLLPQQAPSQADFTTESTLQRQVPAPGAPARKPGGGRPAPAGKRIGLVAFGMFLKSKGIPVTEHPKFGGVGNGHARGYPGNHYAGTALDLPVTGEKADQVVRWAEQWVKEGRLQFLGPGLITSAGALKRNPQIGGHTDHVHLSGR